VIGERLYPYLGLEYYRLHPSEIFGLQMSGIGIFGAVFGGLIGVWDLYATLLSCAFWRGWIMRAGAAARPGHRPLGTFFNRELFAAHDLPWGIYIRR
jgi:prolipoprotein diacylglyceryltransferase